MVAGRKIRLHVELFEQKERKEGASHICYDCLNYTECPILWYRDYRFYPYCVSCMSVYFPNKIDYPVYTLRMQHDHRNGTRT